MERALLEQLLGRDLSPAEIGRRLERHESTVAYWVQRYGLSPAHRDKHRARGAISRDELASLVEDGVSIAQISTHFGRSKATIRHWLGRYGLTTRGGSGRRAREGSRDARAAGLLETTLTCPVHGPGEHVRESRGYYRCRRCRRAAVVRRRRKVERILVAKAGGACQCCGYDRSIAGLEFHHLDPSEKGFGIAQKGLGRSVERLRVEARKCVLLCSNCHAEVEAGVSLDLRGSASG
jgi:transposase